MTSTCPCSDQSCQKPGPMNLGTSYLSEKSPSFYKNPREFFKKHLNEERVFVCRFAMKPCFVLASNSLVKELLNKSSENTYNGLYDFFYGLFGDNILFADDLQCKNVSFNLFQNKRTFHFLDCMRWQEFKYFNRMITDFY